jgi:hypothetical protein
MGPLKLSLAAGFAASMFASAACAGGGLGEEIGKAKPLAYGLAAPAAGKAAAITFVDDARPAKGEERHADRDPRRPLRAPNELRYRYAPGSSLSMTARPRHLSLGWRTQF